MSRTDGYDGYLAMYHDQGHVPVKLLAGRTACALTVGAGVPFCSVGHGPAFDIAGTGKADPPRSSGPEPVPRVRGRRPEVSYQVTVAGRDIAFDCEPGDSVLEAAEAAGWALPYSCRKGVCDVTISPRRITSSGPPLRKTLAATVYRVRRPAPLVTLIELQFPIGRRAPFRAGQYLNVLLPDGDTRPCSLANSPEHNDAAELHVRTEPGGRFSQRVAARLRPGDTLTVQTPFGEVFAPQAPAGPGAPDQRPLTLLATGTGFAPMKSIVLDHAYGRLTRPVHLYWGARTEEDLYLAAAMRSTRAAARR